LGGYLDIETDDFLALADDIIAMIRAYKTDLLNAAALGQYKK
jgi:hypothetical protein